MPRRVTRIWSEPARQRVFDLRYRAYRHANLIDPRADEKFSDPWDHGHNHIIWAVIEDDHVVAIDGQGVDAELMRGYWQAWEQAEGHRACYAVSHVGFGLNPAARWDALSFYDKRDCNGTELRAFAGNFLYSTGANEVAGRHTLGHFDLPLRACTVALDGQAVVQAGQVQHEALAALAG